MEARSRRACSLRPTQLHVERGYICVEWLEVSRGHYNRQLSEGLVIQSHKVREASEFEGISQTLCSCLKDGGGRAGTWQNLTGADILPEGQGRELAMCARKPSDHCKVMVQTK